ncbi:serine/threonine protein phosphatase 8, putative [Plasmodium relictum]|uniref:Serine/threonine-protein phosphatase n=1 Tax=Plasmodium relictum TaxID=85471 RepID=A0A1J1H613_PLARL|nr:serine/threonine protein phosphatase 8, putative [Plasmodium relictum]CRG99042.1 serine/threonine protein phosphatase 8, putative [Plasmodium relictum]
MRNNIEMNENNIYMNPFLLEKNNLNPVITLNKELIIQRKKASNYQFNNFNTEELGNFKKSDLDSYVKNMTNVDNNNIKLGSLPFTCNLNMKQYYNNNLNAYPRNEYNNMNTRNGNSQNFCLNNSYKGLNNEVNVNSGKNQFKENFLMNNEMRHTSMNDFHEGDRHKNIIYLNKYNNMNNHMNNSLFFQNSPCKINNILGHKDINNNFCFNTNINKLNNNNGYYENKYNINDIYKNSFEKIINKNIIEDTKKKNGGFNSELNNNNIAIENEDNVCSFRKDNQINLIPGINQEKNLEANVNANIFKKEHAEIFSDNRLNKTSEYYYKKGNSQNLKNTGNINELNSSERKKELVNPLTHEILNLHNNKNININECSCENIKNGNFVKNDKILNTNSIISSNSYYDINKNNESFSDCVGSLNYKIESAIEENDFKSKKIYKEGSNYLFKNMNENNSFIGDGISKNQNESYVEKETCFKDEEFNLMKIKDRNDIDKKVIINDQECNIKNTHINEENRNITEVPCETYFKKNPINTTSEINNELYISDANNNAKEYEKDNNEEMNETSSIEKFDFTQWRSHNKLMKNIISSYNENIDMENHSLFNLLFDFHGYNKDIFKNYLLNGDDSLINEVMKNIIYELSEEKNNKIIEKLIFLKYLFNEYGHSDHPNLISLKNFKLIFKNYKSIFSSEKIVLFMFNCLDRGKRYHITETDFIIGMLACSPQMDNDIKNDTGKLRHQLIFRAYDLDRDGYLSDNELLIFLYHIYELSKNFKIENLKDNKKKLKEYVISEKNRIMKYCNKISYDYFYNLILNKEIEGTSNLLRSNQDMADTVKKYFLYTYAKNMNIENYINNDKFFITTGKRKNLEDDNKGFYKQTFLSYNENKQGPLEKNIHNILPQNNSCIDINSSILLNYPCAVKNMDIENLDKNKLSDKNIDNIKNEKVIINNHDMNVYEKNDNNSSITQKISDEDTVLIKQDMPKRNNFNNQNISNIQIYEKINYENDSKNANVHSNDKNIKGEKMHLNDDDYNVKNIYTNNKKEDLKKNFDDNKNDNSNDRNNYNNRISQCKNDHINKNNKSMKHADNNNYNENNYQRELNNYNGNKDSNCLSITDNVDNVDININNNEGYIEAIYNKNTLNSNSSYTGSEDKIREPLIKEKMNDRDLYFNNDLNNNILEEIDTTNLKGNKKNENILHAYHKNKNNINYKNNAYKEKNLNSFSECEFLRDNTNINDRNVLNEALKNNCNNYFYRNINNINNKSINSNKDTAIKENSLVNYDEEINNYNSKKINNNLRENIEKGKHNENYAMNFKKKDKDNLNDINYLENKNDLNSTINIKSHCNIAICEELKNNNLYKEKIEDKNSCFNENEQNFTNDIHSFIYKKKEKISGNNDEKKYISNDNEDGIYKEKEKDKLYALNNNLYENILTYKNDNIGNDFKQFINNNEDENKSIENYDKNENNNFNKIINHNKLNSKSACDNYIGDKDMENENINDTHSIKNSNEYLPHFGRKDELDKYFSKEFYDENILDDKIDQFRETVKFYRQKYLQDHRLNTLNQDIAFKIFTIFYKVCYRKKRDKYSSYFDTFQICSYNDILLLCDEVAKLFKLENSLENVRLPCKVFGDIHGNLFDIMDFFNLYNWPMHNSLNELISINELINFENINYVKTNENYNYCDKMRDENEEMYNASDIKYVFLGNYVNRGDHSLEVICFLFSLKILFPKHIYLLRGNHEDRLFNYIYGFYKDIEVKMKKNMETMGLINYEDEVVIAHSYELFNRINDALEFLPLSALLDKNILCIHGGIGDSVHNISDYINVHKPILIPQYVDRNNNNPNENIKKIIIDTLWSDPINYNDEHDMLLIKNSPHYDIIPSNRGKITFKFGKNRLYNFLKNNKLKMIIRGHECVHEGYKYMFKKKLLTLFSAKNYCKKYKNNASNAFIVKKGKNIIIFNQILKSDKVYDIEIKDTNNHTNDNFQRNIFSFNQDNQIKNSENFKNTYQNQLNIYNNNVSKNQGGKYHKLKNYFMNDNIENSNNSINDKNIMNDNYNVSNNNNTINSNNDTINNSNINNLNNNIINDIKTKDIQMEKNNLLNINNSMNNFNFSNSNRNYLLNYNHRKYNLASCKSIRSDFTNFDNKYNFSLNKINKSIKKKLRDIRNNKNFHLNKIKRDDNINKNINYFFNNTDNNEKEKEREKEKNKDCNKDEKNECPVNNYVNINNNHKIDRSMNNCNNSNNLINFSINNNKSYDDVNIKRNILNLIDIEYIKHDDEKFMKNLINNPVNNQFQDLEKDINNLSEVKNKLSKKIDTDTIIDKFFDNEMYQEKNKANYNNTNEDNKFHKNNDNDNLKKIYYSKLTSINEENSNTQHNDNDNDKIKKTDYISINTELLKKPLDYMMPPDLGIANKKKFKNETYSKENKSEHNSATLRSLKSDSYLNDPLNKLQMQYLPPDPKPQTKISFHKSIKKIDH